ncbi:DUF6791 domain-containing protein [Flavobacterium sp.]|uniref:DUF6791 domain-containing protein n=1 Tax=Flavobacterium sp. TaxID=239 RepID=UPI0039E2B9D3
MQPQLISHSPDLLKLWEAGYELEIKGGHLLVHHIPYVNPSKEVRYGTLVCSLTLRTPVTAGTMQDHTMYLIGETPCDVDGKPLNSIILNTNTQNLGNGIVANFHFSSKPQSGRYADYYEKVYTYAEILSGHAKAIDCTATCKPKNAA